MRRMWGIWEGALVGRGGIRKRRKLQLCGFHVQSDGLKEVEEARTVMLAFNWYVDTPRGLRCCPSSTMM